MRTWDNLSCSHEDVYSKRTFDVGKLCDRFVCDHCVVLSTNDTVTSPSGLFFSLQKMSIGDYGILKQ